MTSHLRAEFEKIHASTPNKLATSDIVESEILREKILRCAASFDLALKSNNKETVKACHIQSKKSALFPGARDLLKGLDRYESYFPIGASIDPGKIDPVLIEVYQNSIEERLFRLCRATWTLPYSKGYGRRLRFIVMDKQNDAVIGVIGLQSPPADLACRDNLVGPTNNKLEWVNATMDAFTVGAVGPYAQLIGGKLIAGMLCSNEIGQAYWKAYAGRKTEILGKRCRPGLLAITTTSAFGKSSIYNRLKYQDRLIAEPIGYTKGYGLIHLESVYLDIEAWLKKRQRFVPPGFGNGPKVRWQNVQNALAGLKLPSRILHHGLAREAFLFRHAANFEQACRGIELPHSNTFLASEWGEFWKQRWCIPRSKTTKKWMFVSAMPTIRQSLKQLIDSD
jgi:Domain of unknown function (DUF4338)